MSKTKKICISGLVMAMYIAIMYFTQSFAFGQYQIRIATALYALSYLLPFLFIPLAIANALSNLLMNGIIDAIGGLCVGLIVGGAIYLLQRYKISMLFVIPVLIFGISLVVPMWLSFLLGVPYLVLALSITIGQILPAFIGYFLIKALESNLERIVTDE